SDYAVVDPDVGLQFSGAVYYRVQAVEQDGGMTETETRMLVWGDASEVAFRAFPNPFSEQLHVQFGGFEGVVRLALHDVAGTVVWTQEMEMQALTEMEVALSGLAAGLYVLQAQWAGETRSIRLMKR
ncbi:MAG: T9SS type A sorting domain-containing protein, partial [Bacteroidota bacterium]